MPTKVIVQSKNSLVSVKPKSILEIRQLGLLEASHKTKETDWTICVETAKRNHFLHFDSEEDYEAAYRKLVDAVKSLEEEPHAFVIEQDGCSPSAVSTTLNTDSIVEVFQEFAEEHPGWEWNNRMVDRNSVNHIELNVGCIKSKKQLLELLKETYYPQRE